MVCNCELKSMEKRLFESQMDDFCPVALNVLFFYLEKTKR